MIDPTFCEPASVPGLSRRTMLAKTVLVLGGGISLLALMWSPLAIAADLVADSRITAVTVYPDAAQVTRVSEVELPAGDSSILFKGLPSHLDPNSLRVQGTGGGTLVIGSVDSRIEPVQQAALPSSIAEKLRALVDERNLLRQTLRALQAKKQMIERYAQASPEKLGEKSSPMNVDSWSKAWEAVGLGLSKTAEEVQAAQHRVRDINREIRVLRASNRGSGSGPKARRTVSVQIASSGSGKAVLKLTYRVGGARWLPVYDARLETAGKDGKPSLEIVRRASVTQRTGEDWSGVVLTVSTVRARRGTQAPEVQTQKLEIFEPPPPSRPVAAAPAEADRARSPNPAAMRKSRPVGGLLGTFAANKPVREQQAVLNAGPYEAEFRLPGKIDLKSDGSARILRIATSTIEPDIVVRAAPAYDTTAYLETVFTNKDEAPLLPGVVNIHRNGVFAGRGAIKLTAPGDKVTLGFGADERVSIKRVPVNKSQKGPGWIGNSRTRISDFTTSVKNLHDFAVQVRIIDRIPISENADIVVKPLPSNTTESEKNVAGRRGVLAWNFSLKPAEKKDLRLGWQVEWPNKKRIITRELPN